MSITIYYILLALGVGVLSGIVVFEEQFMVTVMWANECFDPERPDTYFEEV